VSLNNIINSVLSSQKTCRVSVTTNLLRVFREIIAVHSENHTKLVKISCGKSKVVPVLN
jgi:hypothetical protein